jgi:sugar phosphate isomerase/epimerase
MPADESRNLNRRDVLAMGLAAAGTLALGKPTFGADTPESSPYGPFQMGIQSYSLRAFDFDEALARTKAYGLHYWESYSAHISPDSDAEQIERVKAHARAAGIKVTGFGVVHFGKDRDQNRKLFEFGKRLGIEYFSCDPAPESFDGLDKLVEEFGIPCGIHNHGPGHAFARIDTIAEAIKDHHPKIGCCIDTGHFLRSSEDPVRAVEVFDKRIYGVHLKDVKDAKTFTVLGDGDLRLVELLKALAKRNYPYGLALEYEEKPKAPDADIYACLAATRKAVAAL